MKISDIITSTTVLTVLLLFSCASVRKTDSADFPAIKAQGYYTAGGTVRTNPGTFDPGNVYTSTAGQTVHGDHASYFYQIPVNSRKLPMVFLHGITQSGKCWSTTVDGRDGFHNIFLKDGYSVYLVDQPRRGQAGQSTEDASVPSDAADQMHFDMFRIGLWPQFYTGVQFPQDKESVNQLFRQMTPNIGPYNNNLITDGLSAVFDQTGPAIFFTHSAGGIIGWKAAMKNDNVRAIVAIEPGMFVFPEGKIPEISKNTFTEVTGVATTPETVSEEEFKKLARIPIIIYFGDNIPSKPTKVPGEDFWRMTLETAYEFAKAVNSYGGNVTVVHLPDEGIYGNTHFIMSDLNNKVIADHISSWLKKNSLDK